MYLIKLVSTKSHSSPEAGWQLYLADRTLQTENLKIPSTSQACTCSTFISNPFSEFCFSTPPCSSEAICLSLLQALFLLLCQFYICLVMHYQGGHRGAGKSLQITEKWSRKQQEISLCWTSEWQYLQWAPYYAKQVHEVAWSSQLKLGPFS